MAKRGLVMIEAVFFDLDGVLIDSETMHQNIMQEFVRDNGYPIPKERFYRLIGSHKSMNPFDSVVEGIDLGEPKDVFLKKLQNHRQKRLKEYDYSTIGFKDAKPTLKYLKEVGIKTAVASSSNIDYINRMLEATGINDYFDLKVSCDEFAHSKPHPDIYLYCLEYFGIDRDRCLVIEDSKFGIEAAKRAHLKVIAKRDHKFGIDQSEADLFIDDLIELKGLLR